MATHSSVLAWRIPGTGEPGGLPSMGLHRVRHDWSDLAAAAADKNYRKLPKKKTLKIVSQIYDKTKQVGEKKKKKDQTQEWINNYRYNRDVREHESCSVVSDSSWPHGLYSPLNFPSQNTGVGSLSLLQGIFPTQGSNPGLLHCRRILYQLSHKGSKM